MSYKIRHRGGDMFNLNLTPLLDVVLQLITFFMMLIHFGTKLEGATKSIRLPVAPAALPGSDLGIDRLVVGLDRNGQLLVEGEPLEGKASQRWWADQAKRRIEGRETLGGPTEDLATNVVIRADKDASYGMVRRTLAEAQERGFAHFSLVVLRNKER
ncbi:ExbD/TolR family protein [Singulisphaera acidiphila]|uniref:Biopolymer transport protein n=1 Tax=Singulisphaera acidiphila (strain ATCC BAA-1392 / DSM 18658 / VKM B-2454 / MOB10) TaxID=886293 RepID=L0DKF4_SINAD|nr:biopolymer transporter ExbD [Singulisphaera acidiphila]AGA29315.1 biopolymer transport protein [Singulisphaera acidiphila DSM 18658]